MLSLVQPPNRERLTDARDLLFLADMTRPVALLLCGVLACLLGLVLMLSGHPWGGLLVGGVVALALSRYGPSWWPGRR